MQWVFILMCMFYIEVAPPPLHWYALIAGLFLCVWEILYTIDEAGRNSDEDREN